MKLYHATDRKNVPGCLRIGMVAAMATGKLQAVWGVQRRDIDEAIAHALSKRRVRLQDVVVLELNVPSKWVRRFSRPGYFYIPRDVPPTRVKVYGTVNLSRGE